MSRGCAATPLNRHVLFWESPPAYCLAKRSKPTNTVASTTAPNGRKDGEDGAKKKKRLESRLFPCHLAETESAILKTAGANIC